MEGFFTKPKLITNQNSFMAFYRSVQQAKSESSVSDLICFAFSDRLTFVNARLDFFSHGIRGALLQLLA